MNSRITLSLLASVLIVGLHPAHAEDIDAEAIYQQYCAQCHGADLAGGNSGSLIDGIWNYGQGTGSMRRNIKHGITHLGMPAYEGVLEDVEIKELADYIMSRENEAAPEPLPIPESYQTQDYVVNTEVFAEGLEIPWAIAFVDEENALITERPGAVRWVENGELHPDPIKGTPEVLAEGQGGLMDVAVDPNHAENGWIYLAFSHEIKDENGRSSSAMTKIVRGRIEDHRWIDEEVVFAAEEDHYLKSRHHYGSRIVFDDDGHLYFAIGDRGFQDHAQELERPNGKTHRVNTDGSTPEDNPFVDTPDALETIYSYGNRNIQGMAVHPSTGEIWATEHGPMGGDELNVIRSGINYGWPTISYGRNYNGTAVTDLTMKEDMAQPALYWKPSIAVCGLDFVSGKEFPLWENHLLAGALRYEEVQMLTVTDDRVIHNETIVKNWGRVRDVECGPNGAIYVVLNDPHKVMKLTSGGERTY